MTHATTVLLSAVLAAGCGSAVGALRTDAAAMAADSSIRAAIAVETKLNPASFPERSVAVLPLKIISADSTLAPLGYGLADLLMGDLAQSAQVQVVDRLRIQSLLRELTLGQSAGADPSRAPRLGRILGARELVVGQLTTDRQSAVRIDANLAEVANGSLRPIVAGATTLDDILEAEKAVAFRVFTALGVNLTPAERAKVEQRPTRNLAALMAFSRGVRAEASGDYTQARREYNNASRLDRSFQKPQERVRNLDLGVPSTLGVGVMASDAINRPNLPAIADAADPAFVGRRKAILVIPINLP